MAVDGLVVRSAMCCLLAASACLAQSVPATQAAVDDEHVLLARRVVGDLRLSDARVTAALIHETQRYRVELHAILEDRAAKLRELAEAAAPGKPDGAAIAAEYVVTRDRFQPLKAAYVRTLEASLTPFQVERVKDGLTDDALPNLYARYCEMVPNLRPAERAHIMVLLVEMRENAMTAVKPADQEQWQHKYQGIINNYINRQGHDFKTLSRTWDERQQQVGASTRPSR